MTKVEIFCELTKFRETFSKNANNKSKWIIVKVNVDNFELINVKLNNHVNIIPAFAAQLGDEYAIRGKA